MAKISRVFQKLFGSTGSVSFFGEVGSLPAGTKVNTQDPATIQSLSAFLTGLSAIVQSGTYKLALGDLNSLFLLAFYQISYLMQAGVAEWDASTTYYAGSIVNVSGTLYKSLTDTNINNNPVSSPSNWVVAAGTPVGVSIDFAGPAANIPAGYLQCDGSAVSRSTYANLFAAIGTYWGAGDNSTTFNLPNLKGRTTVGYDASETEFNAVGNIGGEKTHALITGEIPAHTHDVAMINDSGGSSGLAARSNSGAQYVGYETSTVTGGGQAHNNLQPYGTVLKIIKY